MNKPDDSDLPPLDALREGDEHAWSAFLARSDESIRKVVAWPKWRFDVHTREEVVQSIKVGIVQSIGRLQSDQSLQAFIRRICVNRCIDALRRLIREQNRLEPLGFWNEDGEWVDRDLVADSAFDPVITLQRCERVAALRAAMARLDEPSRAFLCQFYVEGLSYRDMAERHGVAVNTVGSRLSRCLDKLRKLLEQSDDTPSIGREN